MNNGENRSLDFLDTLEIFSTVLQLFSISQDDKLNNKINQISQNIENINTKIDVITEKLNLGGN